MILFPKLLNVVRKTALLQTRKMLPLDKFGRVLIPKQVRDDLGLKPGTVLRIEEVEQKIFLKPVRGEPHVVIKGGVLIFSVAATGDIVGAIRTHRKERLGFKGSKFNGSRITDNGQP